MTFTPSATSSFSAGVLFWGMCWSVVIKLNDIARTLGFKKACPKDRILVWVNRHKIITLTITEIVNYSVHGIANPLSVMFALGGTIANFFIVIFIVPFICGIKTLKAKL